MSNLTGCLSCIARTSLELATTPGRRLLDLKSVPARKESIRSRRNPGQSFEARETPNTGHVVEAAIDCLMTASGGAHRVQELADLELEAV
jgi:hypothetical protein